jgi:hypothetical protein
MVSFTAKPVKALIVQTIDIVSPGLLNLELHLGEEVFFSQSVISAVFTPAIVNVFAFAATVKASNAEFESITGPVQALVSLPA